MRKFPCVYMRGGTSKGCMFLKENLGAAGTELPGEVDSNKALSSKLEAIRGAACVKMGFAKDLKDTTDNSPAVPKVGFVTTPKSYTEIGGKQTKAEDMDVCARVISVFKCHKAAPLTSASAISVAAFVPGTLVNEIAHPIQGQQTVRVGHPSGVMTMYPYIDNPDAAPDSIHVSGVAVQRTARRIMDGTLYIPR